jgi:1-deoxy-D-xylulose 5-phosphate reductoisomerase
MRNVRLVLVHTLTKKFSITIFFQKWTLLKTHSLHFESAEMKQFKCAMQFSGRKAFNTKSDLLNFFSRLHLQKAVPKFYKVDAFFSTGK